MSGRLILGNLDCESDFAATAGRAAGPLPRRVLETVAGAATLLRAFARDGDRLWLPAPVAPEAMAEVPGLTRPMLESGRLASLEPAGEALAWGETAAMARMRQERRLEEGACHAPLPELPWRLPVPAPEAAAAVNDRRFALELAGKLGCRLPGARMVASPRELEEHLDATGTRRWVLKARFSAAGRWRHVHPGGSVDAAVRRRIERLLARHGQLLLEPWMDRIADFGCAAAVTPEGIRRVSLHRLLVDGAGRFRGLELVASGRDLDDPWLEPHERARFEEVLEGTGDALRRAGYSGAFGIDAWRFRWPGGDEAFHPLGEINGRLTFGWVARALVDRVREPLGLRPDQRVRLMFGRRNTDHPAAHEVPLLHALEPGEPELRLEIPANPPFPKGGIRRIPDFLG